MRLVSWNMGGAFRRGAAQREAAWAWLNDLDADVALVQEAIPPEDLTSSWRTVVFNAKYQQWGCAVLVRDGGYEAWQPGDAHPWLLRVGGAAAVARPVEEGRPWLVSVHSDAASFEETNASYPEVYAGLPPRDGMPRAHEAKMWEIEAIAHELGSVLRDRRFVLGGDLNSALLFDETYGGDENARLFANLHNQGYVDTRPRHSKREVQTFFAKGRRPYQLDHLFADAETEQRVRSWGVVSGPADSLGLSDHAPIEILLD